MSIVILRMSMTSLATRLIVAPESKIGYSSITGGFGKVFFERPSLGRRVALNDSSSDDGRLPTKKTLSETVRPSQNWP